MKLIRLILIVFAVFYIVSPLDPIPDTIPVIGYLDDIIVALIAFRICNGNKNKKNS